MESSLEVGTEVRGARGAYRVESTLGHGGFGDAYRARAADGSQVTLKVMRFERLASWKALELFEREAAALATLSHERIPRIVELFLDDGRNVTPLEGTGTITRALEQAAPGQARIVLVQSYVPGRSLETLLRGGERLDPRAAEQVARELLDVLDYLHTRERPVIHRDIKPSNVVIDDGGHAHLIDFGAIQHGIRDASSEAGSTMIGTMGYFPQEQILGRAVPASDLYALGMTLLVGLTGKPPEEQPLDDRTGKVRPPATPSFALNRFLAAVLEPGAGNRPASARLARAVLDGGGAMVAATPNLPAIAPPSRPLGPQLPPQKVKWQKRMYGTSFAASIGAAGYIHTVMFNHLSESKLVAIAPFWVVPAVFGISGWIALPRLRSLPIALASTGLGIALLYFFLYAIFPSL